MKRPGQRWAIGGVLLALVCWTVSTNLGTADEESEKMGADIRKVSNLEAKGDKAAAEKQARSIKVEDLGDVMNFFKPRKGKTGGFGVGAKPGDIIPDGIEKKIQAISRDGIQAKELGKEADAIAQMAYDAAAIADIALNQVPKPEGEKTPAKWKELATAMHGTSLDLAKAAKAKDADAVTTAAKKLNVSCNKCHSVFRD